MYYANFPHRMGPEHELSQAYPNIKPNRRTPDTCWVRAVFQTQTRSKPAIWMVSPGDFPVEVEQWVQCIDGSLHFHLLPELSSLKPPPTLPGQNEISMNELKVIKLLSKIAKCISRNFAKLSGKDKWRHKQKIYRWIREYYKLSEDQMGIQ